MTTERFEAGREVRREVLGDAYVEAALARATEFNREFQALVTEYCWGTVWTRDGLPKQTRSLLNIAMMVALNRPHELELHVKGARRNGCTPDEIKEVLLQATIYAGVPAGVEGFRVSTKALAEVAAELEAAATA
ncbi:carboxymuconolactone decarboxylase family protein [Rhizomonospora bruguierae]|uniref:carboxymuconolactone decarboxylase family protein n=1 Tax=Rhizomonospora bruguierae TaxID=1581705 RepID=UPI001BD135F3|nr:carboxymuconolactone decarboxylase family protein [Micromonospora sp. NBRC 107566]